MCTSSIRSLEEALIQLLYALGDYHSCGKQDRDGLDASLSVLRKAAVSAQVEINLLDASREIDGINRKEAIFERTIG